MYIYDGNNKEMDRQSGNIIPETMKSDTTDVRIQFTTDHMGTKKGFEIEIKFVLEGNYFSVEKYSYI